MSFFLSKVYCKNGFERFLKSLTPPEIRNPKYAAEHTGRLYPPQFDCKNRFARNNLPPYSFRINSRVKVYAKNVQKAKRNKIVK